MSCHWRSGDPVEECELRTFEGIARYNDAWRSSGGNPKDLKNFYNCREKPLNIFPATGVVVYLVPPSPLHLKLGIVNLLWKELHEVYPGVVEWASRLHVSEAAYFGGHFEGRQCSKLLSNTQVLRDIVANDNQLRATRSSHQRAAAHPAHNFIEAFEALNDVMASCFGPRLEDGFEQKIRLFDAAFRKTGWLSLRCLNEFKPGMRKRKRK